MGKHTAKEWLIAVRPWSFPASAMPVIVSLGYLFTTYQDVNWVNGVWALLNIIVFHAAGNTWSDWFDYRKEVDKKDTFGAKTLTSGMFTPKEIMILSLSLLTVAVAAGIGLWLRTGMPLLYIGIGGALCSLLYPFLKFNALGDLVIFIAYALLPMLGTVYVGTETVDPNVLFLAVPVGSITVAILHVEVLLPFVWLTACAISGVIPWWTMAAWGAFIPAMRNAGTCVRYLKDGASDISGLDEATAKLQMVFSFLLAAGLVISGILS